MRIGIDGNEANVSSRVGVSVYTLKLLTHFREQSSADCRFTVYLKHPPLPHMPEPTKYFQYYVVFGPVLWSRVFFPARLLLERDLDVFFSPAHYSPALLTHRFVVTIHDLSYFYYPNEFLKRDLYKLRNWTKHALSQASRVITVSECTKKDVMRFYGVSSEKIRVIYNGFEKEVFNPDGITNTAYKRLGLQPQKYFLYVGTIQPRKNIKRLIEAYRIVRRAHPELRLVITGKKGWLSKEITDSASADDSNTIIFTGYLPDDDVVSLYKNALCLVMPSLYEGFGIPVLEAMSHGCPVLASQVSSLPEIGGDACVYFDPESIEDIAVKMARIAKDIVLRDTLIAKGTQRLKIFSWKKCAAQTLAVLQETANGR